MTLKEFKKEVIDFAEYSKPKQWRKPNQWRKGQAVFNYIDHNYGIARTVQFKDGIDCFYNDDVIDEFINKSFSRLSDGEGAGLQNRI